MLRGDRCDLGGRWGIRGDELSMDKQLFSVVEEEAKAAWRGRLTLSGGKAEVANRAQNDIFWGKYSRTLRA